MLWQLSEVLVPSGREQWNKEGEAKARPLMTFLSPSVCLLPKQDHSACSGIWELQQSWARE